MTMKLYAVRDLKAESFANIMCIPTQGLAIRSFAEACADPRSEMNKYPEDFMLYEIGSYEPNSAQIVGHSVPKLIADAASVVAAIKSGKAVVVDAPAKEEVAA